ncbi:MAG: glutathione synthase [Deltaproteobacteria bacterium]|nr:glutathione synthase [Deltaproteobacteria bacterium]
MIVSFHPIYEGDHHRLCAGRDPDAEDLAAIKRAAAVILPQGCRASLYRAATRYCKRVFPNYAARFAYPGKQGQSRLFQQAKVPHPQSFCYPDTATFFRQHPTGGSPLSPPAVFKLDWGGEGDGVFPIMHDRDMTAVLKRLQEFETTGQKGFILQQWIPAGARSLRVVVTGHQLHSYWRVMPPDSPLVASLSKGGAIDRTSDHHLIAAAEAATRAFCRHTGINLAGFDFLFSTDPTVADPATPLFLEINYFFGRRGLGGSAAYYQRLLQAIDHWLENDNAASQPTGGNSIA